MSLNVLKLLGSSQEISISFFIHLFIICSRNMKHRYNICIWNSLPIQTNFYTCERSFEPDFLLWNCFQPTNSVSCELSTMHHFFYCTEGTVESLSEQEFQVLKLDLGNCEFLIKIKAKLIIGIFKTIEMYKLIMCTIS